MRKKFGFSLGFLCGGGRGSRGEVERNGEERKNKRKWERKVLHRVIFIEPLATTIFVAESPSGRHQKVAT